MEGVNGGGGGGGTPAAGGGGGVGTPTRKEDRLFSGDISDGVGGGTGGAPRTGGGGGIPAGLGGSIPVVCGIPAGCGGGIQVGAGGCIPTGGGIPEGRGGGIPTRQEDVGFVTEDRLFSGDKWDKVGGRDGCLASVPVEESPILMLFALGTTKSFRELMASTCFDSFRTGSELEYKKSKWTYYTDVPSTFALKKSRTIQKVVRCFADSIDPA